MPLLKLWSSDHGTKKIASASTLADVLKQAAEKGVCSSENAKVFLRDWTEVEEETFTEVVSELPLDERIFIVAERAPQVQVDATPSGSSNSLEERVGTMEESTCYSFKFDGSLLLEAVRGALGSQSSLPPRERRELVRSVVDKMTRVTSRPRRELIRSTSEELVNMYPNALQDRGVGGQILGRGYDSVFQQIENRIENINRGKRPATGAQNARQNVKAARYSSYGCLNWQPMPSAESAEDINQKIEFLKQEGKKTPRDINFPLATRYMADTYCQLREFVNAEPPRHTAVVKEEWPVLFKRPFFYAHANRLLGKNVKETFEENVRIIGPSLVRHLQNVQKREIIHVLLDVEQQEKRGNSKANEAALLPLLAAFFKDNSGLLFKVVPEGTSLSDILLELPSTPVIVAIGSIYDKCHVICEQEEMFSQAIGFSEAACLCFLIYYVFNMDIS
ncbi:uncharacterized protein LOC125942293 isoform X2 [Dermacentor silvarum]|nr:uncharacterized protein LOC125942293 isoform X2 [Dermacentor silvarum]